MRNLPKKSILQKKKEELEKQLRKINLALEAK